jgi:hypothetical protein
MRRAGAERTSAPLQKQLGRTVCAADAVQAVSTDAPKQSATHLASAGVTIVAIDAAHTNLMVAPRTSAPLLMPIGTMASAADALLRHRKAVRLINAILIWWLVPLWCVASARFAALTRVVSVQRARSALTRAPPLLAAGAPSLAQLTTLWTARKTNAHLLCSLAPYGTTAAAQNALPPILLTALRMNAMPSPTLLG